MNSVDHATGLELIRTGAAVDFEIVGTEIHESADPGEFSLEIQLAFPTDVETEESDLTWGSFGFMFLIGLLSFTDARARESSAIEYSEKDEFHLGDLIDHLHWDQGTLRFSADYIRGRRMKTELVLRPEGTGRLGTTGRGKSALFWLEKIKGKKSLQVVP
jgi:hypothetical protein